MQKRSVALLGITVLMVAVTTGCVSKKVYRQNVEETDTRVHGVESGVEANERRIADLSTDTDRKVADARQVAQKAVEIGNNAQVKAEQAEKMAKGKVLWTTTLSDDRVKFSFDQKDIPEDAAAMLDELANKIKGMEKLVYVEIEGHTDDIGSPEYNFMLGEKRADAVRAYLNEKAGIPLHIMNVISYGEEKPQVANNTPESRAQNRRVVIRVLE